MKIIRKQKVVESINREKKMNCENTTKEYKELMLKIRAKAYFIVNEIMKNDTFKNKLDGEERLFHAVKLACSFIGKELGVQPEVLMLMICWDSLTNMALFEKAIRENSNL